MIDPFWLALTIIASVSSYFYGKKVGVKNEWARCTGLCFSALQRSWSPTLRWAYNAIYDGKNELRPMEDFIAPDVQKMDAEEVETILNSEPFVASAKDS